MTTDFGRSTSRLLLSSTHLDLQQLSNRMGKTSLLLLGTGFIGGSVLAGLLDEGKYEITALSRSDDKAKKLHELGVKTIKGSLDDEIIVKAAKEHDVGACLHETTQPRD